MATTPAKKTREEKMKLPWEEFDRKKRSDETGTEIKDESLTQLSQQEQSDINWIVRNFMPEVIPQNVRIPMEGDFTGITDYATAINNIRSAQESFMRMPAELRAKLQNDPQRFIDWCSDEKNLPEMRKLGLAIPEPGKSDTDRILEALKEAPSTKTDKSKEVDAGKSG